jgi:RHS repeat-associated protein
VNGQNRNQAFTYDNVGRLATATGWGVWARRFDYDRYGNRTAVWDAVSGGSQLQNTVIEQVGGIKTNRIASVNGTSFSYDASGNVTGDGARAYTYDAENRIVSVSGPVSESYGYDAGNHRVRKEVGGVVTHYIWEDQVIAEYERGGAATPASGTRYYHPDRLSTRVITDGAGAVVGTTDHLPFGEEAGVSGAEEKHKFTTYERDGALDYAVNRHYDPRQGRFNQVDPLGLGASSLAGPQSLNPYNYVRNDPVNVVDPIGLRVVEVSPYGLGGSPAGSGFFIDGVPVSAGFALNYLNNGLGYVQDVRERGVGVFLDGNLVIAELFGTKPEGGVNNQQAFFDPSIFDTGYEQQRGGGNSQGPTLKKCPPSGGVSLSFELNGSAFAGFGAGTAATGSVGGFFGLPYGSLSNSVLGGFVSRGALFLNHSAPSSPGEGDRLRPATGQGFVMGAGAGVGILASLSRNATAAGYQGVSRSISVSVSGVQISASFNQGSIIPSSIGFGPSVGPGVGIVSQPVKTSAIDTSSRNCK